jgi:hypothetical protein
MLGYSPLITVDQALDLYAAIAKEEYALKPRL